MARRLTVTFPDDLYAVLERRSEREARSIANLIVVTLRKAFADEQNTSQPRPQPKRPPRHC